MLIADAHAVSLQFWILMLFLLPVTHLVSSLCCSFNDTEENM